MGALRTGGQGSVYKARRTGEIITAVKLLPTPIHSESPEDKHFRDFQNEVQKLKKVNEVPNPNVVRILSSGITETGAFPFIEMEFIEGPDLEELLKPPHDPIFTIKEATKVAEQLSSALAHCHKVDVKHGDIKSNNVKFNLHTGNYVLLDFGLAAMSDEQRRTSLRHAGAIEFMAPEQNEGMLLMQSDVYGYGVIMFELLAGVVPFPLQGNSESARNAVRLAHMETAPPDLLALRGEHMPESWSEEKKQHEMLVPEWLVSMIYRCLEKRYENRFANGKQLHDYIVLNSSITASRIEKSGDQLAGLQAENTRLRREKEQLQQLLAQYQEADRANKQELQRLRASAPRPAMDPRTVYPQEPSAKRKRRRISSLIILLLLVGASIAVFALIKGGGNDSLTAQTDTTEAQKPRSIVGQYKVVASRAYFHNEPDPDTRRTAYMIPSNNIILALDDRNGFVYTEFTNNRGQTSRGWLNKKDLMPLDEWLRREQEAPQQAELTPEDINSQLADARRMLENNQVKEALYIYKYLADQEVPEAMFEYGNLALQRKNTDVDCGKGLVLVEKASDKGYAPAKRTLGFLYIFADNKEILRINDYDHCSYDRNVFKGTRLLYEAVSAGDTTARRILDELNLQREEQTPDTLPQQ
jgi:eukaryotic-like serine/threonine-protein kinase